MALIALRKRTLALGSAGVGSVVPPAVGPVPAPATGPDLRGATVHGDVGDPAPARTDLLALDRQPDLSLNLRQLAEVLDHAGAPPLVVQLC